MSIKSNIRLSIDSDLEKVFQRLTKLHKENIDLQFHLEFFKIWCKELGILDQIEKKYYACIKKHFK